MMTGLQQNKDIQERYKNAYKEIKSFLKDQKKKDSNGEQQEEKTSEKPKAVIGSASVATSFSASSYPLANSFILDCSSLLHIYNDLSHFNQTMFQKLNWANHILTSNSYFYIEGYGEVHIKINTPTG